MVSLFIALNALVSDFVPKVGEIYVKSSKYDTHDHIYVNPLRGREKCGSIKHGDIIFVLSCNYEHDDYLVLTSQTKIGWINWKNDYERIE